MRIEGPRSRMTHGLLTRTEGWASTQFRFFALLKELLHIRDGGGDAVRRQALEKGLPVTLARDARVEQHQHTAIFKRTDEPAEALLQGEDGGGDLVVEERLATGFFNCLHARLDDRVAGYGKRQPVNDDATERLALHIDALPEAGSSKEHGIRCGTKLVEESFARRGAVQKDREVEHRQQPLVEQ